MVPGLVLASTNQREYCIQVQPCLTVARRPNACLGHRDGINVPGHARSTRLLPKEVLPSVPDVFCPYRACFASPVGLEDVACYARRSQPSRLGRKTVLLRRGQRTAGQTSRISDTYPSPRVPEYTILSLRRVILSRLKGQAELQRGPTHECTPPEKIARFIISWPSGLVYVLSYSTVAVLSPLSELLGTT